MRFVVVRDRPLQTMTDLIASAIAEPYGDWYSIRQTPSGRRYDRRRSFYASQRLAAGCCRLARGPEIWIPDLLHRSLLLGRHLGLAVRHGSVVRNSAYPRGSCPLWDSSLRGLPLWPLEAPPADHQVPVRLPAAHKRWTPSTYDCPLWQQRLAASRAGDQGSPASRPTNRAVVLGWFARSAGLTPECNASNRLSLVEPEVITDGGPAARSHTSNRSPTKRSAAL